MDATEWACQELIEGRDSATLRMLSSLSRHSTWWEAEPLLRQAFHELSYEWHEENDCYWACARDVAKDIVSGELPASEGAGQMFRLMVALDYPQQLLAWVHICADLDPESLRDIPNAEFAEVARREAEKFLASYTP